MSTPDDIKESTSWKILRSLVLKVIGEGFAPLKDQNEALAPHLEAMEEHHALLREAMANAHREGMGAAHAQFHKTAVREYESHELLDEAVEYAAMDNFNGSFMPIPRHERKDDKT